MPKSFREINNEIISALDVVAEYRALGVRFPRNPTPRSSGMVSAFAFHREDKSPSAFVNVVSGYYGDLGSGSPCTYSLWDFATKYGGHADWQAARKFYAEKAGVTIGKGEKKGDEAHWRDRIMFEGWETPGNDILAARWCLKFKKGITVDSIKAAGGKLAYYPCYRDKKTKELKRLGKAVQVVALPAYGEYLLASDPVAWVIWDVSGAELDVYQPKGSTLPKQKAKMLSIGSTRGAMMGLSGLMALCDDERRQAVTLAWKTGGPTDMLGVMAAIGRAGKSESHVVVTNASGETGDVLACQTKLFAGLHTAVIGDADEAGVLGAAKWCRELSRAGGCLSVRNVKVPFPIVRKHGLDVRDFLNGACTRTIN